MARKAHGAGGLIAVIVLTACSGGAVATPSERSGGVREAGEEVVERFIDAFNEGDIDRALGLIDVMSNDISGSYLESSGTEFLRFQGPSGRPWLANLMAAGAQKADPECTAGAESPTGVTVTCTSDSRYSYREAVGAPALATTTTFEVADGYIVGLEEVVEATGANIGDPFWAWVAVKYPEDEALRAELDQVSGWTDLKLAIAAGEAEARHVDEYAAYLEENGCEITGC